MPPRYRRATRVEESCGMSYLGPSGSPLVGCSPLTMEQSSSFPNPVFWCFCTPALSALLIGHAMIHKLLCAFLYMIPSCDLVSPRRYDFMNMYLVALVTWRVGLAYDRVFFKRRDARRGRSHAAMAFSTRPFCCVSTCHKTRLVAGFVQRL